MIRRVHVFVLALIPIFATASLAADPAALKVYQAKCFSCHLAEGKGPLPPMDFTDGEWKHGNSQAQVVKVIRDGVPGTAMLGFKEQLTPAEIAALAKLVRSYDKTPKAPRKSAAGK